MTEYRVERVVDSIPVPVSTGDKVIEQNELPSPDVVKMDVEGAAPDVIRGMSALEYAHTVYVEPHDNFHQITDLLSDMRFSVEKLDTPPEARDYLIAKQSD